MSVRAAGHSMYGQGQAGGGIVLDLRAMNRVGPVTDGQVTVQAGRCGARCSPPPCRTAK
ncbi:FAD-binding protein [Streptomyces sp. NPDC003233]